MVRLLPQAIGAFNLKAIPLRGGGDLFSQGTAAAAAAD